MRILVKKLDEKAKMPSQTYESDFCYDVVATSCEEVAPNVYKYGTGLAMQISQKERKLLNKAVKVGITLRPRSSIWKTGMVLSNCIGTIDEHYTGEICAVFYHVMPNMPKYEVGNKIGQLHFDSSIAVDWIEVNALEETERGANGYGSTGK